MVYDYSDGLMAHDVAEHVLVLSWILGIVPKPFSLHV